MSLITVTKGDIAVGEPLPWPLYDQTGGMLMAAGTVIPTSAEFDAMIASNPLREITLNSPGNAPADSGGNKGAGSQTGKPEFSGDMFAFADMRLRVGDRIQLQPPARVSQERFLVKLIGYLENTSLLVTMPTEKGLRVPLRDNDNLIARVFTSQKAFGFNCSVIRACKIPYDYLHLSFPSTVQGSVVRKSPRVRTKIIASISRSGDTSESKPTSGIIFNLSADGAQVRARQSLAANNETIILAFRVNLHNVEAFLSVPAIVRSQSLEEPTGDTQVPMFSHGLQFGELKPNECVILQSLIYKQMIEQPQSLI